MKLSFNWLKEFVDINVTPEKLGEDLTMFGHQVESIEKNGDDFILDFEITSNRGDCLSVLGMAREIAALYGLELRIKNQKLREEKLSKNIEVKITDSIACPRFSARVVDNIEIKESPKWMQEKLSTYGFRPINNIVDITNYVMVATGQPLHAFDYDKIKDGLMHVRLSKKAEEVMTLDGKNHVLPEKAIVIEDTEKIYDLAGIMGGYKSEVDENTKTIVLQGAIFDPILIRKASKFLHHQTDASYRYERGVDYEGTMRGVDLAASLIQESCGAKIGELTDIKSEEYQKKNINIDLSKINKLIGIRIDSAKAADYLKRLGFETGDKDVTVPSYRDYDVRIWQDIAEEIARMYGYNKIGKNVIDKSESEQNKEWKKREAIKEVCMTKGFTEVYSYSFADKDKIEELGFKLNDCVETSNPIAPELKYLRPDLLPLILSQIAKNPWDPQLRVFEIEKVFDKKGEKWQLGIAVTGKQEDYLNKVIDALKANVKIKSVDQKILDLYKIRRPVKYAIVDIDDVVDLSGQDILYEISSDKYQEVSKFPPTVRDLSFFVDLKTNETEIITSIKKINNRVLLVELFDVYEKEDSKSLAVHIWLQDLNGPLNDIDANKIIEDIIKGLETKFQAKIRR